MQELKCGHPGTFPLSEEEQLPITPHQQLYVFMAVKEKKARVKRHSKYYLQNNTNKTVIVIFNKVIDV